jgi:hypothetical protein
MIFFVSSPLQHKNDVIGMIGISLRFICCQLGMIEVSRFASFYLDRMLGTAVVDNFAWIAFLSVTINSSP